MFDWKDNTKNTDEELAAEAAQIMYHLSSDRIAPLQFVIEKLVMPNGKTGYTEGEMKKWILQHFECLKDFGL